MNSMTLLRSLFIAGAKIVKANPELGHNKNGEEFMELLDAALVFLDASHGFVYNGKVKMRGAYVHLIDLNQDFDDVIKAVDSRFGKTYTYSYTPGKSATSSVKDEEVQVELAIFTTPEDKAEDAE